MFGRSTNNGSGVNLNSRLYTSFSDTCMVVVTAWNQQISIRFHPAMGQNADGVRQYAQEFDACVSTSLVVDNAIALLSGVERVIIPALNDKDFSGEVDVSISMGNNENRKVMTIKYDGTDVYLGIFVNVDENGVASDQTALWHKFNKRSYMKGYDNKSGSGEEVPVQTDFINFMKKVETIYQMNSAIPHAINFYKMTRAAFNSNNNSGGGFQQNSGNNFSSSNSGYEAPVSSTSELSSFIGG